MSQLFIQFISKARFGFSSIPMPKSSALSVLGLQGNPSFQDIKTAYFKLSKRFHPDICQSSIEKFKEIAEAYKTLKSLMNEDENRQFSFLRTSHYNEYEEKVSEEDREAFQRNFRSSEKCEQERKLDLNAVEEKIYRSIFGESFKENPAKFYDLKNKALRERFEAEMEHLLEDEQYDISRNKQRNAFYKAREHFKEETHHTDHEYIETKQRMKKMFRH